MCNPMAIMAVGAGVQAVGAYNNAQGQKAGLDYQARVAQNNATMAEYQAQDALRVGQGQEQAQRLRAAGLKSTQRASMAANGIDITEGSANDVLTSTDVMGEHDALTLRDNAIRQAWGYRVQGSNYTGNAGALRASADSVSPMLAAGTTMLTSAGSVAGQWGRRDYAFGGTQ